VVIGEASSAGLGALSSRSRRRQWWAGSSVAAIVVVAVIAVLLGKAAVYQPLSWGNQGVMPVGVGIRVVNNFGRLGGDYYVPPERVAFTFGVTLYNNGSRPITITRLTLNPAPDDSPRTIWLAGPVLYTAGGNFPDVARSPGMRVLHNVTIGPGREIFVDITLRTWPCDNDEGWFTISAFYVQEHFLAFHHTVALPWTMQGGKLIMHNPGGAPGDRHSICAPQ
jgi:hypothetical protein